MKFPLHVTHQFGETSVRDDNGHLVWPLVDLELGFPDHNTAEEDFEILKRIIELANKGHETI